LPAVLLIAGFFLYPALRLLWTSVTTPEPGISNYTAVFSTTIVIKIILRTLGMSLLVTVSSILIAYPYAYLINISSRFWSNLLFAVVLIPLWTSLLARTFSWVVIFQENGILNKILGLFGASDVTLLGSTTGVTIAMAQVMLPFAVLPLVSTMRTIDKSLLPAALSLGAKPVIAFFRVYLPQTLSGLAGGATLVMVLSLGFYVTPALVGSPQNSMLAQYIRVYVNELANFGYAGALSVVLLLVTLLLLAALRFATQDKTSQLVVTRG